MDVYLSSEAISDLHGLVVCCGTPAHPDAGARQAHELLDRVSSLGASPERGPRVEELHWLDLREIRCRSTRIIYRANLADNRIEVVRFLPHEAKLPVPEYPGPSKRSLS
jgi:plasmid stabilization system protein ParE